MPPWRSTIAFTTDRPSPLPAAALPVPRRIDLVEAIEDERQMLRRDAETGVADRQRHVVAVQFGAQLDFRRQAACGAARWRRGSAAPVRAAADRRRESRRRAPTDVVSGTPLSFASGSWRAATRPNRFSTATSSALSESPPASSRARSSRSPTSRSSRSVSSADDVEAVRRFRIARQLAHREHFAIGAHRGQRRHQLVRHVGQQHAAACDRRPSACSSRAPRSSAMRLNAAANAASSSSPCFAARAR